MIVATTNESLTSLGLRALRAGKHVLVEKPAARSVAELDRLMAAAARAGRLVRVGFNHRYHPALQKARALVDAGALGPLMFVRGRYGHGGRVGLRPRVARRSREVRRRRTDRSRRAPDRSRALVPRRLHDGGRIRRDVLLGHAGRRQRLHAARTARADRVAARQLHGVEEPVLARDLRPDGQARDRRPRRQLRRRTADVLPDAARDGAARDDDHGVSGGDQSWAIEFAEFLDDIRLGRSHLPAWPRRARRSWSSKRSTRDRATPLAEGASRHDHHAQPAADHARRRRHRPAVVLPRARRLPDRRGDRQVRLRHGDAAVHAGHLSQVLEARARRRDRRGAAPDHSRSDAAARLPDAAARNHHARRHPRGHRARLVRQLHDGAAARRCTRTAGGCCTRASSPSWPATSRSTGSASRSASRISTSRPTAA